MGAYKRGEQLLLGEREPEHVSVGDDVLAVTMVVAMRDIQAYFVQTRSPGEKILRILEVEAPAVADLTQQVKRCAFDPFRLTSIDVGTIRERVDTAGADVVLPDAAE